MDYVSKSSLAGKRKRKTQFNDNVRELTIKELEGIKSKKTYSPGMAVGVGGNEASEIVRCTYYPLCTSTTEHKTANSKNCDFNKATKEQRKMASKRLKTLKRKGNLQQEQFL